MGGLNIHQILKFYPEKDKRDIRTSWSNKNLSKLYILGFKMCSHCGFLIKTNETFCRICRYKMRTRIRYKKNHFDPLITLVRVGVD